MSHRRLVALIVAILALAPGWAAPALAQEEPLEVRLERFAGIRPEAAKAFFDALRRNVGQNQHDAACGMVAYPLAHPDGAVNDVAGCVAKYDAIFTIAVRRAVGRQRFEELFVNETGAMLGVGELWFAGRCTTRPCASVADLRIRAIAPDPSGLLPPKGKVLLACAVSGQKIRVSADGAGGASLSVWYAPTLTGAPGREFPKADPPGPPTTCGSRTWVFKDDVRTYTISELPCDAYLSPPPMGSVGRVSLSTSPTPDNEPLWCRDLQD